MCDILIGEMAAVILSSFVKNKLKYGYELGEKTISGFRGIDINAPIAKVGPIKSLRGVVRTPKTSIKMPVVKKEYTPINPFFRKTI